MGFESFVLWIFDSVVGAFGSFGLLFAFSVLVLFMVFQAIVAPIASEAVLSSAGGIFDQAFPTYGILVAITGGIIGSLLGAITAFYIARWAQKHLVSYIASKELDDKVELSRWEAFLKFLARFIDEDSDNFVTIIEEKGFLIVLVGRILPFVPFDAVSYGSGFTKIHFKDFMIATTIGTIPRVIFYVLIGTQLASVLKANVGLFFAISFGIFVLLYVAYKLTNMYLSKNRTNEEKTIE